jgi:tRNA(Ile2) C34 agmatinyltransferase TiaS
MPEPYHVHGIGQDVRKRTCERCGASYESRWRTARYCPTCQPQARKETTAAAQRRYQERRRSAT